MKIAFFHCELCVEQQELFYILYDVYYDLYVEVGGVSTFIKRILKDILLTIIFQKFKIAASFMYRTSH